MNTFANSSNISQVKQSHPQVHHPFQISSSTAGEITDNGSEISNSEDSHGYSTPASRVSTPNRMAMTTGPPTVRAVTNMRDSRALQQYRDSQSITPGQNDSPYIRFAIEQLTFDEELTGRGRHSSGTEYYDQVTFPTPLQPVQQAKQITPPRRQPPNKFTFPRASSETNRPRTTEMTLLPSDPPRDRHQLGYVPTPLRLISLGPLVLLCILFIIALIASNVYALTNHGLYNYDNNFTPSYFVFEYLPPLLGMIVIFWLFVIQAAIYRIAPYFALSKNVSSKSNILQTYPTAPANFLLPDWRFFKIGEPLLGAVLTIFWLMNWTIPLLSCLFGTQWFTNVTPNRFRWSPVQGLGYFIMFMYLLLLPALGYCMIRFRKRNSALMWDPDCLADLIILFQRSNILSDYMRSETMEDLVEELPERYGRLGYWTTNKSPDYFYAVGESNKPYLELSPSFDRYHNEKTNSARTSGESQEGLRNSQASSFARMLHSPFVRHRWCPWFVKDGAILAWSITLILLLIAFFVLSFVNQAVRRGFFPMIHSTTRSDGFSPSNFVFSFIPALLGMILFLAWQPIDVYFRTVQPYANLSDYDGATARRSILLSYNADLPGFIALRALMNRDFKVAYFSLISLMSATIPVLAGGVFTALLFADGEVRMVASMPGYIALCVILTIYALSFLVIWPTRFRYLPHSVHTIAGNLSFLYASRLLKDSSIRNIRTKADFIARLDGRVSTSLTGNGRKRRGQSEKTDLEESRFGFGIYIGVDGAEHLGIDRMSRPGTTETMVVTTRQQ